jgi:hypothetical protein
LTASPDRVKKNLWFGYFSALIVWTLVTYSEIVRYLSEGTLFARMIDGRPYVSDTVHWYNAALLARKALGGSTDIYDPAIQDQSVRSIIAPIVPQGLMYLQYPPQFFPLMLPFSFFPITIAYFIWCAITLVLICVALWFLLKDTVRAGFPRAFAFAAAFACFPAWLSFELAQTSLFQLPATIGFWLLMWHRKFFWAGLLTGAILTTKIQYLPAIGLAGLILGGWRYLAGCVLSGALLAVATFANVGWSNIASWPRALKFGETSPDVIGVGVPMMQNLRGELVLLMGGDIPTIHTITMAVFVLSFIAIALMWWKVYPVWQERFGKNAFGLCVAVSILTSLIASPHTHIQEFFTAAAAMIFLYPAVNENRESRVGRILYVLCIAFPFMTWALFLLTPVFQMIRVQPFFAWAVAMLMLIFALARTQLRSSAS